MTGPERACLNCGTALRGRFCHECGQEATEVRVPLSALVNDGLGDLFALDSRILRTLRPLLAHPGFLTTEWIRGRRAPYVPPLRLYLFVAALFFLTLAMTDVVVVRVTVTEQEVAAADVASPSDGPDVHLESPRADFSEDGPPGTFGRRLATAWQEDPAALQNEVIDRLGTLSIGLPPLLGLLLALAYRRRRRFMVEHMVFSFHLHTFAFIVTAAAAVLPAPVRERGGSAVALGVVLAYLFVALRRVYGGRRWVTAVRLTAIGATYLVTALLPSLLLALVWAVMAD